MFSGFLKYIVPPFTFRIFFRRIFYSNLKKVPLEKPLLFVGNHQNSFMDGILVGSYLPQPIHFTMRADMFRKPIARFSLRELNVTPVYRMEEGLENVHKNLETFADIYDILKKNGNFIMFSEGVCIQEKRLHKLRKGTARLAFGAEEKFGLDVNIVPVGINYTYPARFRKEVMINFSDPFSIKEFMDLYRIHPAKALLAFNDKCETALKKEVIIIENPENDLLTEQLLVMERNDMVHPFFRWMFNTDDRRMMEKNLADKINNLAKESPAEMESLRKKVDDYTCMLKSVCIKDENIARKLDWGFIRYLSIVAGFPLFITGYIANIIPFVVPRLICSTFIKDPRFYSSVYISSGTALYLIYFPLVLILAAIFGGWIGFLSGLLVPLLGYLVLFYQEVFMERLNTFRYGIKSVTHPSLVYDLKTRRQEIKNILDNIRLK